MTKLVTRRTALLLLISLPMAALAQDQGSSPARVLTWTENSARPKATLAAAQWLQGAWEGMLESAMQEHIVFAPVSGQMPSFARAWGTDGTIWFYEIGVIAQVEGSLEFRVKHFTSELAGWEGKDDFVRHRLMAITDEALYFDGITFIKDGPESHTVHVRLASGERQGQIVVVHQRRVKR